MRRGDRRQRRDDIRAHEPDIAQLPIAQQAQIEGRSPPLQQTPEACKRRRKGVRAEGGGRKSPGESGPERDDIGHKGCFQIEGNTTAYPFVMVAPQAARKREFLDIFVNPT